MERYKMKHCNKWRINCELLMNISKKQDTLKMISYSLLNVWLNEMEYFAKKEILFYI